MQPKPPQKAQPHSIYRKILTFARLLTLVSFIPLLQARVEAIAVFEMYKIYILGIYLTNRTTILIIKIIGIVNDKLRS